MKSILAAAMLIVSTAASAQQGCLPGGCDIPGLNDEVRRNIFGNDPMAHGIAPRPYETVRPYENMRPAVPYENMRPVVPYGRGY
jgi:hypothetical protein